MTCKISSPDTTEAVLSVKDKQMCRVEFKNKAKELSCSSQPKLMRSVTQVVLHADNSLQM